MERHSEKCPNCGRDLAENEIYCYFCEMDVSKLRKEHDKTHKKYPTGQNK